MIMQVLFFSKNIIELPFYAFSEIAIVLLYTIQHNYCAIG